MVHPFSCMDAGFQDFGKCLYCSSGQIVGYIATGRLIICNFGYILQYVHVGDVSWSLEKYRATVPDDIYNNTQGLWLIFSVFQTVWFVVTGSEIHA